MEGEFVVSGSQGHEKTFNFLRQYRQAISPVRFFFFSGEICWILSITPLSWTAYLFFILVPVAAAHLRCITMPALVPLNAEEKNDSMRLQTC